MKINMEAHKSKTTEERVCTLEELILPMAEQVQEMYKVFTSANWAVKVVLKVFGAIGVITGAIIGIIELIKRFK